MANTRMQASSRPRRLHLLLPLQGNKDIPASSLQRPGQNSVASQSHSKSTSPATGSLSPFPGHSNLKRGFELLYQLTGNTERLESRVETERSASCLQTTDHSKRKSEHSKPHRKNAYMDKLKQALETYLRPPPLRAVPLSDIEKLALLAPRKPQLLRAVKSMNLSPSRPRLAHTRSSVLKRVIDLPALTPGREPQFKPTGAFEHLLRRNFRLSVAYG